MKVLTVTKLSKRFAGTHALKGISFAVEPGEIFGFLGPNGAGKSTTLHCIMDYIRPTSGTIKLWGKDARANATTLKQRVAYVPSEPNLYHNWTVQQHIAFVASHQNLNRQKLTSLLQQFQLESRKKVGQLSTGNQQKLAIVLALARESDLLLLDEPTRGLDPLLRATLHSLLREYQKAGGTIVLSSHDLSEVEDLCNSVAIIRAGEIVSDTSLGELKKASAHKFKVGFGGAVPDLSSIAATNLAVSGHTASFTTKASLDSALQLLAEHKVTALEVSSASLEDIFMELYAS